MQIRLTTFPNQSAMRKDDIQMSWAELATYLASAKGYASKFQCPWLKLATFGMNKTKKLSLRHDMNVTSITGVEGDYDGEKVGIDDAILMLEKAGIKAIVYSSPSHTEQRPRWRVIAPCSQAQPPHTRYNLIGRINGALGGILSPESFVLSQSYYYGAVNGAEYRVEVTWDDPDEGECIDELVNLDEIAIYKQAIPHQNEQDDKPKGIDIFDMAVRYYGRKLQTGDGRREMLKSYMASRSARGLSYGEVMSLVNTAVEEYFDPADPMDIENIEQIAKFFADKDYEPEPDLSFLVGKKIEVEEVKEPPIGYPAPFRGAMYMIYEAMIDSAYKPQPELSVLASLIAMASCITGEYSTPIGSRFNLYGIGSLGSGGGKDNPRSSAEEVAGVSGAGIIGKPSSGAALEDYIIARHNHLISVDEMSFMLEASNDPKAPAFLKDLVAVLLKLYSSSKGVYHKRVRAKQQGGRGADEITAIPNSCVSLLGFSTPEGFAKAFKESNLTDGLIGRMIYVKGRENVRARMPDKAFVMPDDVLNVVKAMQPINKVAQAGLGSVLGGVLVGTSEKAQRAFIELLEGCEFDRDRSVNGSAALYARSFEKIQRISGVLAIWDDPTSPMIELEHIQWAKQMVYASDAEMLKFVSEQMADNEEMQEADKLRETIKRIHEGKNKGTFLSEREAVESGYVARSHLLRASKMKADAFNRALSRLHDLGEITAFDEKGKKMKFLLTGNIL